MSEEAKKMDSISEDFIEKAIGSVSEETTETADEVIAETASVDGYGGRF